MNTKNATLIAVFGTAITIIIDMIYAISPHFFNAIINIVRFVGLVPPICVLIFFVTLYSKQSNQ